MVLYVTLKNSNNWLLMWWGTSILVFYDSCDAKLYGHETKVKEGKQKYIYKKG